MMSCYYTCCISILVSMYTLQLFAQCNCYFWLLFIYQYYTQQFNITNFNKQIFDIDLLTDIWQPAAKNPL